MIYANPDYREDLGLPDWHPGVLLDHERKLAFNSRKLKGKQMHCNLAQGCIWGILCMLRLHPSKILAQLCHCAVLLLELLRFPPAQWLGVELQSVHDNTVCRADP